MQSTQGYFPGFLAEWTMVESESRGASRMYPKQSDNNSEAEREEMP